MGILRRTVFVERDDRTPANGTFIRPADWAMTVTTLGSMAEPFCMFNRNVQNTDVQNVDFTDETIRVDKIETVDLDKLPLLLSGGSEQIHGGVLIPRTGR